MALQFQFRRGTTTQTNTFTGALGEVTVDTDKDTIVVHDGTTIGGFAVAARADASGTITLLKKDGTSAGVINTNGLFNNTLTSTNTDQAATAAQVKVLNDNFNNKSFGVGQTYQNMTGSRSSGVTYTNSTSKTIYVIGSLDGDDQNISLSINGNIVARQGTTPPGTGDNYHSISAPIPSGSNYSFTISGGTLNVWELR